VAHHGHLMQRWLTVEDNVVIVLKMSLNYVTNFQMLVGSVLQNCYVDQSSISSFDILSSWPYVSTSFN